MSEIKYEWVEAWIDQISLSYILILRKKVNQKVFEIVDPQEKWKVIETFAEYYDATNWLTEDEYFIIEGRYNYLFD